MSWSRPVCAAQITGDLIGSIADDEGRPVAGATVLISSPSGTLVAHTDSRGRFTLVDVTADRYTLRADAPGFLEAKIDGIAIVPGTAERTAIVLHRVSVIATVTSHAGHGATYATPADAHTIAGEAARGPVAASSSGLGGYTAGTVQGAIATVAGMQQDQFANAIPRGGQSDDVIFSYDGVPVPQALIAEPGGNVIGTQLPTTGVAFTNLTLGGFNASPDVALGAAVDEVPFGGTYPQQMALQIDGGVTPGSFGGSLVERWATPDLRLRYAFDVEAEHQDFAYGDGHTFYPVEAATYGLSLANRSRFSIAGNVHIRTAPRDDLEVSLLSGASSSDQYGTPFAGLTYGTFNGVMTTFPGASPDTPATSPSRIRGNLGVAKIAFSRRFAQSSARLQIYRSFYNALTNAPFFDDLSFPVGAISYYGAQRGSIDGIGFDVRDFADSRNEIGYGIDEREEFFSLDETVPRLDEAITSHPMTGQLSAYLTDRWLIASRWSLLAALRAYDASIHPSTSAAYVDGGIDTHTGAIYDTGRDALRILYDRVSVAPRPLEIEQNGAGVLNAPLAPERAGTMEISYQHRGVAATTLTYFNRREHDRIDVLPQRNGLGIAQNTGDLNARGFEGTYERGGMAFDATYQRAYSSSASQFALNNLNAAAIAAGHLFPVGYVPDFTATLAYRVRLRGVTITPMLSWESGFPYGNGRKVWTFGTNGQPEAVDNDNYVNPGYNYYFLQNPAQPYNAATNRYIASLGTAEGDDPNTLRTPPQLLVSVHVDAPLRRNLHLMLDVDNLFGVSAPTQNQGNPYLIGPPGYRGGNANYASWYGSLLGVPSYTLGNGIPTNDGTTQSLPWAYGTNGYIASSYPLARTMIVRAIWQF